MQDLRIMDGELVFATEKVRNATSRNLQMMHWTKLQDLLQTCMAPYVVRGIPGPEPGIAPGVILLPGPYRFYVDVAQNLVVRAVAPAATIAAREHERRMHQLLAEVQQIDAQTIHENRALRMTNEQRAKLGRAKRTNIAWIMGGVPLVFGFMLSVHIVYEMNRGRSPIDPVSILMTLGILVCLWLLPSSIREQKRLNSGTKIDITEGRLDAIEGVFEKSHIVHKSYLTLSLKMNGETFVISDQPQLFAALVQGCRYRAHVARNSRRLVSIELLEGPVLQSI